MNEQTSLPKTISSHDIRDRIYTIRGMQVMLDRDIAKLYSVETRVLNQAVSRNPERFPESYCFQLSDDEFKNWKSQIVMTNSEKMGLRRSPYAFSERGVAMLSTVLRSNTAIVISMRIMDAFVEMRHYLADNSLVFQRLDRIELKQLEADEKFNYIFRQLEAPKQNKAVVFFRGQMWDATSCIEEIIGKAEKTIILIDGYVDRNTLDMLSRKKEDVAVAIYTFSKSCILTQKEISAFSAQYGPLSINYSDEFHDRFLILDNKVLYHIGASIKDAGKKAFEISLTDDEHVLSSLLARL